ncbi:MAG: hypothetical protein IPH16_08495 [Haliscomenobacter sp.]|nr:hypothetical protein [Haliscomenobacter sp.]
MKSRFIPYSTLFVLFAMLLLASCQDLFQEELSLRSPIVKPKKGSVFQGFFRIPQPGASPRAVSEGLEWEPTATSSAVEASADIPNNRLFFRSAQKMELIHVWANESACIAGCRTVSLSREYNYWVLEVEPDPAFFPCLMKGKAGFYYQIRLFL